MLDENINNKSPEVSGDEVSGDALNPEDINPEKSIEAERDLANIDKKESDNKEEKTRGITEKAIDWISNKLKGKDVGETPEDAPKKEVEGAFIPDAFVEAALTAGWDEDTIIDFASTGNNGEAYSDDELLGMIDAPQFHSEEKEKIEKTNAGLKKEEKPKVEDTKSGVKDEKIAALEAKIVGLENRLSADDKRRQKEEAKEMLTKANEFFDKISDELEVFGKTKDLRKFPDGSYIQTTPEYEARSQVVGDAIVFYNNGSPWDGALKKAYNAYKGEHLEDSVTKKVIRDLKKNEKRLSPDRYNKVVEKTYKDETERRVDVVKDLQRKAGLKVED